MLNAVDVQVDYDRLYKEISVKDPDAVVSCLLENWSNELSPHWDKIIHGMSDPQMKDQLNSMDEEGRHQKIIGFDQYGMGKRLAKEASWWLLKNIPIAIGYLVSLALRLVLVGKLGKSVGNLAMLIVLVPPFLFYLVLRYSRVYLANRKKQSTEIK